MKIVLKGDKALERQLLALPGKVARKVVKSAATASMQPVLSAARRKVKPISPTVAKSLKKKTKTYRNTGTTIVVVGPNAEAVHEGSGEPAAKTANFIEHGTKPHVIRTPRGLEIQHPGAAAHPFLRPAFDENEDAVLKRYKQWVGKGVVREAKKLEGKA